MRIATQTRTAMHFLYHCGLRPVRSLGAHQVARLGANSTHQFRGSLGSLDGVGMRMISLVS